MMRLIENGWDRIKEAGRGIARATKSFTAWAMGLAAIALALTESAQAGGPPVMPPIVMPVDVASVVSEVAVIGGIILLAVAGLSIAFALAWKVVRRARGAV